MFLAAAVTKRKKVFSYIHELKSMKIAAFIMLIRMFEVEVQTLIRQAKLVKRMS